MFILGEVAEPRADPQLHPVLDPGGDVLPASVIQPDRPAHLPLLARMSTDPSSDPDRTRSDSASLIRKPARHRIAISPQWRSAYGPAPASRMTRMISSTVGGSPE